jgi:hypothetical protein
MLAPADEAKQAEDIRADIIAVVKGWHRGELVPRSAVPALMRILDMFEGG